MCSALQSGRCAKLRHGSDGTREGVLGALPGVIAVRNRAVPSREYADCPVGLRQLVDDPIGSDAKRAKSPESPAQDVACQWIALEET
jgi:hypothetical protein